MDPYDELVDTDHRSGFERFKPNLTVLGFSGTRALVLVGILLVAVNLRPAIASVSPVLEQIRSDLGLGYAAISLLTAIPTFCMGLFAFATPLLARRLGRERTVFWAIVLIGVATVARIWSAHVTVLFTTTIVVGIGIAIAQTLLPELVSEYFANQAGYVTGLYTTSLIIGGGIATSLTVPLVNTLGSWPIALAAWSSLAVIAALVWTPVMRLARSSPDTEPTIASSRLPWRHPLVWALALFFVGQTILFYSMLTWLAPLYVDLGWSPERAGFLLTVAMGGQLVGSLCVTAFIDRFPDRRPVFAVVLTASAVGLAAIAFVPLVAPWFWAVLLGFGTAGSFALGLTLPVEYAPTPDTAGLLSSVVLGIGYLVGAFGPFVIGWMRGLTGGYQVPFSGLAVLSVIMLVGAIGFRPDRTIKMKPIEQRAIKENDLSDEGTHDRDAMRELTIERVNQADEETFVDVLGGVYETSPWVAERAYSEQPFSSVDDVQETMENAVQTASREEQLRLLRAHPDLGEKTEMTEASQEEQASVGLDQLPSNQYEAFQRLNEAYQEKFGFPFIMAVKNESPGTIRDAMEERIDHSKSDEFRTALNEVNTIARFRLEELLTS